MLLSQSPQAFLERAGVRETLRTPAPVMRSDNPIHTYPLDWPLPRADYSMSESGVPSPDRMVTQIWPHGQDHS